MVQPSKSLMPHLVGHPSPRQGGVTACAEVGAADGPCLLIFQAVGVGVCEYEEYFALELSTSFRKGSLSVRIK